MTALVSQINNKPVLLCMDRAAVSYSQREEATHSRALLGEVEPILLSAERKGSLDLRAVYLPDPQNSEVVRLLQNF